MDWRIDRGTLDSALRRSESRRKGRKLREANGLELSIETAKKVSGWPAWHAVA